MVGFNPYLIGGTLIAGLALALGLMYYRAEAIDARADAVAAEAALVIAVRVNEENQKTIAALQKQRELDNAITERLSNQLADLRGQLTAATEELEELKTNDPTVRDLLDTPVPDALRQLLDR